VGRRKGAVRWLASGVVCVWELELLWDFIERAEYVCRAGLRGRRCGGCQMGVVPYTDERPGA